ncbi:hypothetical protein [Curtobacterium sp. MCPF17_021]|uniref:hypothetical protein n=1 Tax=Curtobacterium sp. MCPF17_021 TaxID=2175639 RepID=UPI000DA8381D|nr:hypothetical protein [Curtobacterium sp. MCPF17_021]WIE84430.1 hypothetical protein DEJ29_006155 [Curtobacterium sp. MCPF17_021]
MDVYTRIAALHHETFRPAAHLTEPPATPVYEADVLKRVQKEKLKGVSVFARARRREALADAAVEAQNELSARRNENERQQRARQAQLDYDWARLVDNDSDTVMAALAAAFEDNDAAAAPLGISGDEATLVVIVPSASGMPQKKPDVTATGRPTIKAVPKKEAADWHKIAVAGCILVSVKEAFAVAPGLRSVRIVATTMPTPDAYGNRKPEVLVAAQFERSRLDGVKWTSVDSIRILNDVSSELQLKQVGVTKALAPLMMDDEPDLQALLAVIDFAELGK